MQISREPLKKLGAPATAPAGTTQSKVLSPALQASLAKKQKLESLSLPEFPHEPSNNMADYGFLFSGERGIGKTSLSSQFSNPFHLMFEPGGTSLRIRARSVMTWDEALRYRDMVVAKPEYCDNVTIDTSYMSYERCFDYTIRKFGITDPNDEAWGNVWKLIEREFRDWYFSFLNNGIGVVCISHTEEKEIKRKVYNEQTRKKEYQTVGTVLRTEIGAQAKRLFKAIIDVEGYYYQDWDRDGARFLRIKAADWVEAKNRIKGHFLYTNGIPMEEIPMGNSEEEAYSNLVKAFNNQFDAKEGGASLKSTAPVSSGTTLLKRRA